MLFPADLKLRTIDTRLKGDLSFQLYDIYFSIYQKEYIVDGLPEGAGDH